MQLGDYFPGFHIDNKWMLIQAKDAVIAEIMDCPKFSSEFDAVNKAMVAHAEDAKRTKRQVLVTFIEETVIIHGNGP